VTSSSTPPPRRRKRPISFGSSEEHVVPPQPFTMKSYLDRKRREAAKTAKPEKA